MFRYQGNGWRVAESLEIFGNQIMEIRGTTASFPTDGTIGDSAHQGRVSDHNPDSSGVVRALDFHESSPGFVDQIAEQLRAARDPRLKYFIHDDRMFSSYSTSSRRAWEWGPYGGPNPHSSHGHLSVVAGAIAESTKPWQIGSRGGDEVSQALRNQVVEAGAKTWLPTQADIDYWMNLTNDPTNPEWMDFEQMWAREKQKEYLAIKAGTSGVDQIARNEAKRANDRLSSLDTKLANIVI
jgi:hypothetical protein